MTVVNPSLCLRKCPITIYGSGSNSNPPVLESGIYAVLLNGNGVAPGGDGYGSVCPVAGLPDDYFATCQPDGQDICFTSDEAGLNPLPMEFCGQYGEFQIGWDWTNNVPRPAGNFAVIWVAVPLTADTDTTIYAWYKSSSGTLTQPAPSDPYGSQTVWNGYSSASAGLLMRWPLLAMTGL